MGEWRNPCLVVRPALIVVLLLVAVAPSPTIAGPFADGIDALMRKDYATAMRLLRPLADRGDAFAQVIVGRMYKYGDGVEQSSTQAAMWYRKAAEQGNDNAQNSLAILYETGDGVPKDYAEALKWTLMAAKQGNFAAQSRMSSFYKIGQGVPQNYILAYMWESVAGHDPDYELVATHTLDELAPHMAPSQIAEAQSLAQQCVESHYAECPPAYVKGTSSHSGNPSQTHVPLKMDGGTFQVPVEINGTMTLDFAIDGAATDVTVPIDVFSSLMRTGTVKDTDVVGQQTYVLADVSKAQSANFTIRSLRIGEITVENVNASVTPSQGSLVLGQSFLKRFKSWSIDNTTGSLLLEAR